MHSILQGKAKSPSGQSDRGTVLPKFGDGVLVLSRHQRGATVSTQLSISRCANLQRMKRRWKRKQKLEANDTETKLIIKEGGGKNPS